MLIEFSVTNFRSIREKQTFSMVAAPRLKKKGNVFDPDVEGEKLPGLLKIAAIYGPNASGKSNLLEAFNAARRLTKMDGRRFISVSPFRFDPALNDAPSEFEINFIADRQRYTFELSCTSERIVRECLIAYPKGKEALLYERKHHNDSDIYEFGSTLEGGEALHDVWKKLTGPRVLFIRQAVANSSEDIKQLHAPFEWLDSKTMMFSAQQMDSWTEQAKKLMAEFPLYGNAVSGFLQEVDVPVTDIKVEPANVNSLSVLSEASRTVLSNNKINLRLDNKTTLTHKTALGEANFDFAEESTGTQNLIGFFLAWNQLVKYIDILVVDELDSSLHPEIVALLIEKHIKTTTPSQLIFTTHDTHLMDTKLMRRDQFWITERDRDGATQLRSVHDFEGRDSEDIEKRYFEGRYRGLPIIKRG